MTHRKEVLSNEQIQQRIQEIATDITADYRGKKLVLLGVLNGAFIFLADLCRAIDLDMEIDFIRVASYGTETETSGTITLSKKPELNLKDKEVLLVEDIVDTGLTLAWLVEYFNNCGAHSVKVCTLVDKQERREVDVVADYVGFSINKGFLVGYGLDQAELYRNLPSIYTLK